MSFKIVPVLIKIDKKNIKGYWSNLNKNNYKLEFCSKKSNSKRFSSIKGKRNNKFNGKWKVKFNYSPN